MGNIIGIVPGLAVLVGAAVGGSSGLYIKGLSLSSFALAGFRMGVPFLILLPLILRKGRGLGEATKRKTLWTASALNAVRMVLYIMAYKLTAIGNAVVLLYLWPVFALLFDCVKQRRRPAPSQIALLVIASAGVAVMNLHRRFSLDSRDLLGSVFMIVSAAVFAVTAILFKDALDKVHETDAIYFQNAVGAVIFLPFLAVESMGVPVRELLLGSIYGFSVGVVGFGCFFFAMKRLPLFQYSALSYMEVPIGVILGIAVLKEGIAPNQIVGAVLIIAASWIAQRQRSGGRNG